MGILEFSPRCRPGRLSEAVIFFQEGLCVSNRHLGYGWLRRPGAAGSPFGLGVMDVSFWVVEWTVVSGGLCRAVGARGGDTGRHAIHCRGGWVTSQQ